MRGTDPPEAEYVHTLQKFTGYVPSEALSGALPRSAVVTPLLCHNSRIAQVAKVTRRPGTRLAEDRGSATVEPGRVWALHGRETLLACGVLRRGRVRAVRQAAHWSGGLKSLRPPDEGGRIQRRG